MSRPGTGREPDYRPRIADGELASLLAAAGAVVIEGPRMCGKTTTARQVAASEILMDVDPGVPNAMAVDPRLLLEGHPPRLIDEWQVHPAIWNHVRRAVDDRPGPGHFILTGSAIPRDDVTRHTGAGRINRLRLRPMSLVESGHSTGDVSVGRMLQGRIAARVTRELPIEVLAEVVCVGGWPDHLARQSVEDALIVNQGYAGEIARTDIARVDGTAHHPGRVTRFMQSLARNTATTVSAATLARDSRGADFAFTAETARAYLAALEQLMVVEQLPVWAPHLRSRSRLRNAPKRNFVDPSLAAAALGAGPEHLVQDLSWLGFLFESLVVRDLRVYAQANRASVYHYRDNTGLEVDAIVDGGPGRWGAFEIKLGQGRIEEAARALLKFAGRVDTERCGEPAVLAVITGSGYGYRRTDGVCVVPVGALGP